MNVKRLDGDLLNFWVAKSMGLKLLEATPEPGTPHDPESGFWHPSNFHPASNWSHAGPIVSNEWYVIEDVLLEWFGPEWPLGNMIINFPTSWFMRAYVASQYGDEVEELAATLGSSLLNPISVARLKLGNLRGRRDTP
jgi:hypothetical protein